MKIKTIFFGLLLALSISTSLFGQTQKVTVKLHSIEGYGEHEEFARKAAKLLEDVLNSKEFEDKVKNATFTKTNNLTNVQLHQTIMTAREKQGDGGEDRVVDLRVRTLRIEGDEADWKKPCEGKTIGIDGNGDGITAICPNKLETYAKENDLAELAAHYAHEYAHILGFSHRKRWWEGNSVVTKSFVYQVGDFVYDLAAK